MLKFLTIDCPKCDILEDKLKEKKLEYEKIFDMQYFEEIGVKDKTFPMLQLEDGTILDYLNAVRYVNKI